jgi:hypothetical protein
VPAVWSFAVPGTNVPVTIPHNPCLLSNVISGVVVVVSPIEVILRPTPNFVINLSTVSLVILFLRSFVTT